MHSHFFCLIGIDGFKRIAPPVDHTDCCNVNATMMTICNQKRKEKICSCICCNFQLIEIFPHVRQLLHAYPMMDVSTVKSYHENKTVTLNSFLVKFKATTIRNYMITIQKFDKATTIDLWLLVGSWLVSIQQLPCSVHFWWMLGGRPYRTFYMVHSGSNSLWHAKRRWNKFDPQWIEISCSKHAPQWNYDIRVILYINRTYIREMVEFCM